jgi:hypothetical protein
MKSPNIIAIPVGLSCVYFGLAVPLFLEENIGSTFLAVTAFVGLKILAWYLWVTAYEVHATLVASWSYVIVAIGFIIQESVISTIGLNVILLAYSGLIVIEALMAISVAAFRNFNISLATSGVANMIVLIFVVNRLVYGEVPFGYGP